MEFKQFQNKYIIRLDRGEEIVEALKKFCEENNITLGWIKGIGAVNKATIGIFETKERIYKSIDLEGDFEITSLLGNISTMDNQIYLHLHVNISNGEYKTFGGHLNSAVISATGEILIEAIEGKVQRKFDDETGLNLYDFSK